MKLDILREVAAFAASSSACVCFLRFFSYIFFYFIFYFYIFFWSCLVFCWPAQKSGATFVAALRCDALAASSGFYGSSFFTLLLPRTLFAFLPPFSPFSLNHRRRTAAKSGF